MEKLLLPISDSSPCGEYLKGNRSLYRGLRNSFNQAQSSYRQLMESPEAMTDEELLDANASNWAELATQCEAKLTEDSKDVEVFCWFITAQVFTRDPLANLSESLSIFSQIVEVFWDDLHPKPPVEKLKADDEAGQQREWIEYRLNPLLQLVGESEGSGLLYMPLQSIPLVNGIDYGRFYAAERAGELEQLKADALQQFSSEKDAVTQTIEQLGSILNSLSATEKNIATQCQKAGATGLSFKFIRELVERLLNAIRFLVGEQYNPWPLDKVEEVEQEAAAEETAETGGEALVAEGEAGSVSAQAAPAANAMVSLGSAKEIYTRDQAFQELRKIADYFNKTEPHSPVYMLLERAIRWGYMSLPELLNEMVGDNDLVMGRIHQLAGLESIEKTPIPEAKISARELQYRQSAGAVSTPVVNDVQKATVDPTPAAEPEVSSVQSSSSEQTSTQEEQSSSISSFEW